jgi:hypothetical protein
MQRRRSLSTERGLAQIHSRTDQRRKTQPVQLHRTEANIEAFISPISPPIETAERSSIESELPEPPPVNTDTKEKSSGLLETDF